LRSRIGWIKEGDANTTLFHAHARYQKNKNFIAKVVTNDGLVLTSHDDKAGAFDEFYNSLLGFQEDRDTTIDLDALGVPSYDLAALDVPFSKEEVWETTKRLPSDRAPGPDGFTGRFYKSRCLSLRLISWQPFPVWARKFRNMRALNSAFITLLPKTDEASHVKDYTPISLVHSFAKLVTKILSNRLVGWLQQMVSLNQSAFIKKRFIQDNFMLVQQTVRFLHQQRQPRILFKLDISKAFDSVSWTFLLEIMKKMGFGQI
jgi:hypothetical protein